MEWQCKKARLSNSQITAKSTFKRRFDVETIVQAHRSFSRIRAEKLFLAAQHFPDRWSIDVCYHIRLVQISYRYQDDHLRQKFETHRIHTVQHSTLPHILYKMPRRTELTPQLRFRICELHSIGWDAKKIHNKYPDIPVNTIKNHHIPRAVTRQ